MIRSHGFHSLFLLCFILTTLADYVYCDFFQYSDPFKFMPYNNNISENCCPLNFKYEDSDRKCIVSNETSIVKIVPFPLNGHTVRVGFLRCEVLVHLIYLLLAQILNGNGSLMDFQKGPFPLPEYCIDTLENNYIQELRTGLRKAHNYKKDNAITRVCYRSEYCTKTQGFNFPGEYGEFKKDMITTLKENFAIFNQKVTENEMRRVSNLKDYFASIFNRNDSKLVDVEEETYCFAGPIFWVVDTLHYFFVETTNFTIWLTVRIISCIVLIATMIIHVFFYKLEKVLHRIVFCYCIARLIAFAPITYWYLYGTSGDKYCKYIGFVLLFGVHAGFSWLTVMCFDMWRTIGSMTATEAVDRNKSGVKKTFYYCLYGWSLPALLTIFCYIEHIYNILPQYLHAELGERVCYLEDTEGNYGRLLFISPIPVAAIANIVFFALTLRYIIKVTDNIKKMTESTNERKQLSAIKNKTCIALKLFLMMGINWSFDIVTYLTTVKDVHEILFYIELFLEILNCYQGIYIFWTFLLKWTLARSIITRFALFVTTSVDRIKTIFCGTSYKITNYEMAITTPYSK